jgi:D-amino-acid oxidase
VAAAFWYPYKAEPREKSAGWAQRSLSVYKELTGNPAAGILWSQFVEYFMPDDELPWWHSAVEGFSCDDELIDLSYGKRKVCRYTVPVVDTSIYLLYLNNALKNCNVETITADLSCIEEAFEISKTVVNCSGVGAIKLAKDDDLHAARGQVVRIKNRQGVTAVVDLTREPKIAHVTPRIGDTILGGTYEEHVYDLNPDPAETTAIIERCKSISPQLMDVTEADILSVSCGLRPVRSAVRVEREWIKEGVLLHNYGHGGAGFTLSWGCAEEICKMLQQAEDPSKREYLNKGSPI